LQNEYKNKMNYADKSKKELIDELLKLQQSFKAAREQYDKEISLLKQAEEKFRKAFMTSPDSVNINRLSDGMFISVNEGFTKILGYSEEETIGKTSLELNIWTDPEDRKNLTKELQENGKAENFEAIFRKKDGGAVNGLMSASLIDLDGIPGWGYHGEDYQKLLESLLKDSVAHYNPVVKVIKNDRPEVTGWGMTDEEHVAAGHAFYNDSDGGHWELKERSEDGCFACNHPDKGYEHDCF